MSTTNFNNVMFEKPNEVVFDVRDMSNVSFKDSDVTRIRFSDKVTWGGDDKFTIIEEEILVKGLELRKKSKLKNKPIDINLEIVLAVYRNLRENYEFRLRYEDAGKFFIKEMNLKRKYREAPSVSVLKCKLIKVFRVKHANIYTPGPKIENVVKENGYPRRHFSLTGLYYHLSDYGESILKPTLIGITIVGLSTRFWLLQNDPIAEPYLHIISGNKSHNFINVRDSRRKFYQA